MIQQMSLEAAGFSKTKRRRCSSWHLEIICLTEQRQRHRIEDASILNDLEVGRISLLSTIKHKEKWKEVAPKKDKAYKA